jgi:hypothetical protein
LSKKKSASGETSLKVGSSEIFRPISITWRLAKNAAGEFVLYVAPSKDSPAVKIVEAELGAIDIREGANAT